MLMTPDLLPAQFLCSLQTHDSLLFLPFLLGYFSHSESKMELPLCQPLRPSEWCSDLSGCHSPPARGPLQSLLFLVALFQSPTHPAGSPSVPPESVCVSPPGPSPQHLLSPGFCLPALLSQVIPISISSILLSRVKWTPNSVPWPLGPHVL